MTTKLDIGRIVGLGVVTKWEPSDLDRKAEFEAHLRQSRGLEGASLEEAALEMCAKNGITHERAQSYNTLVNGGTNLWCNLLIGGGGTTFTNGVAALGVGDSAAAFALTQTNLQGAVNVTNRVRKAMNATYPSVAANVITFQSTFATTDANFTWNEWAIFNNITDGSGNMLNRAVASLGSKTSASAWQLTTTLTLS